MNLSGSETTRIEPLEILRFFYPEDTPLRRLLLQKPKPLNKFRDPHLKTPDKRRQK